jgi:hypothetical protein
MDDLIKLLSAGLTPILGILAAYIAWQQWRTNHLKVRHDLYERRLSIYFAVMEFLAAIMRRSTISDEELMVFLQKTRESYFLFGQEIGDYLDELYRQAVDLQARSIMVHEGLPDGDERTRVIHEKTEISKWFTRQFEITRTKFTKYMRLT